MPSLSLTGPSPNPDLDHTVDQVITVHSHDTDIDGISVSVEDISDAAKPTAVDKAAQVSYVEGDDEATITIRANKLSDNSLYLLTVTKQAVVVVNEVKEVIIISASIHLDTRPMNP